MLYQSKQQKQNALLKIVFKISEQKASQADILRIPCNMLNDLEKVFYEDSIEHEVNANLEEFNKGCFFARIINNDKELRRQQWVVEKDVAKRLVQYIKVYRRIVKLLKMLNLWRLAQKDDANLLDENNKLKIPKQSRDKIDELLELIHQHHAILKVIQQRQWIIQQSRYTQVKRVMQAQNKQRAIPLLVGMTNANQLKFIKGYFFLKEKEVMGSSQLNDQMTWLTLQQVKVLGDDTGNLQVNTHLSDEHCLTKLRDFENDERVKQPLVQHLTMVIEQTQLIREDKKRLVDIKKQFSETLENADEQLDDLSDREKELLEDLDIAEFAAVLDDLGIDSVAGSPTLSKRTAKMTKPR